MKKVLKVAGIMLLLLIAVVLVGGLMVPKHYHFEKKIAIEAGKTKVWNHMNRLSAVIKWMPWMKMDPKMSSRISGDDGNVGAAYVWKSEKLGDGKMVITAMVPYEHTNLDLYFGPNKTPAHAQLLLAGDDAHSEVTWTFDIDNPYPLNFIMRLFMGSSLRNDFGAGLEQLKHMSEQQ